MDEQAAADADGRGDLAIDGYAELTVARVLPLLDGLTRPQLWQLLEFERRHANRVAVINAIEHALG